MILLVADEHDTQARWLAELWEHHDARLLTPADLSRPGWSFRPGSSSQWTGVAGGGGSDHDTPLAGILNCLAEVSEAILSAAKASASAWRSDRIPSPGSRTLLISAR